MKKLSLTVLGMLAAHSALAMDIAKQKMDDAGDVISSNPSSFSNVDYPTHGIFVQLQYGMGHAKNMQTTGQFTSGQTYSSIPNTTSSKGNDYGLQVGYENSDVENHFLKFLRVQRESIALEVDHQSARAEQGQIFYNLGSTAAYNYTSTINSSNRLMIDGKVNIFKVWHFSPYISAGVGLGKYGASYSAVDPTDSDTLTGTAAGQTKFVSQFGAGIDWFVSRGFTVTAGYKYVNGGSLSIPLNSTAVPILMKPNVSLNMQEIFLGANLAF